MSRFDETLTDQEFARQLDQARAGWLAKLPREESDLTVDGLRGSFFSRLLGLFRPREQ